MLGGGPQIVARETRMAVYEPWSSQEITVLSFLISACLNLTLLLCLQLVPEHVVMTKEEVTELLAR